MLHEFICARTNISKYAENLSPSPRFTIPQSCSLCTLSFICTFYVVVTLHPYSTLSHKVWLFFLYDCNWIARKTEMFSISQCCTWQQYTNTKKLQSTTFIRCRLPLVTGVYSTEKRILIVLTLVKNTIFTKTLYGFFLTKPSTEFFPLYNYKIPF